MTKGAGRERLLLVLAVLALTLPFVKKAVHIDDWTYLTAAHLIGQDSLSAFSGMIPAYGWYIPANWISHPPFIPLYLLLASRCLGSWSPLILHLTFLPFTLLAAFAAYELGRRFTANPLAAAILVVGTPAFLVDAHNLMTDVPGTAFMLAATAAYLRGADFRRLGSLAEASLWTALAFLTIYQSLFLIPLFLLYAWLRRVPWRVPALVVGPGLALLGLFCLYVWIVAGVFHPMTALSWATYNKLSDPLRVADNLIVAALVLGGTTIFPLFFLARARDGVGALWSLAAAATGIILAYSRVYTMSSHSKLTFVVLFSLGFLACLGPTRTLVEIAAAKGTGWTDRMRKLGDDVFLLAWFFGFLGAILLLMPMAIARYLLPLLAPLACLYLGRAGEGGTERRRASWTAVATAAWGLCVAMGDYQQANANRTLAELAPAAPGGFWFTGEHGFRHYFAEKGGKYLLNSGPGLRDGDLVVDRDGVYRGPVSDEVRDLLEPIGHIQLWCPWPVKTMSQTAQADFYAAQNGYGLLPFGFDGKTLEGFRLLRYHSRAAYGALPDGRAPRPLATFPSGMALLGLRKPVGELVPGQLLEIEVLWRVPQRPPRDIRTFLAVKGAYQTFTFDHPLFAEHFPPAKWRGGSVVTEKFFRASLSRQLCAGRYELRAVAARMGSIPPLSRWPVVGSFNIAPAAIPADEAPHLERTFYPPDRSPGWQFSLIPGTEVSIPLEGHKTLRRFRIESYLVDGHRLGQGQPVAQIEVQSDSGRDVRLPLRAGLDTADSALFDPAIPRTTFAHKPLRPEECLAVAGKIKGCSYLEYLDLPHGFTPSRLRVRYLAREGALVVQRLNTDP